MNQAKKAYIKPKLLVYGDLRKLTLNADARNADIQGINDSAFPNIS